MRMNALRGRSLSEVEALPMSREAEYQIATEDNRATKLCSREFVIHPARMERREASMASRRDILALAGSALCAARRGISLSAPLQIMVLTSRPEAHEILG